jgi:hypothetical protein
MNYNWKSELYEYYYNKELRKSISEFGLENIASRIFNHPVGFFHMKFSTSIPAMTYKNKSPSQQEMMHHPHNLVLLVLYEKLRTLDELSTTVARYFDTSARISRGKCWEILQDHSSCPQPLVKRAKRNNKVLYILTDAGMEKVDETGLPYELSTWFANL